MGELSHERRNENDELEKTFKEKAITYFKVHIWNEKKYDKGRKSKSQSGVSNRALLNMKSKCVTRSQSSREKMIILHTNKVSPIQ